MVIQFETSSFSATDPQYTYKHTYSGSLKEEFWSQLAKANVNRSPRAHALLDLALKTPEILHVVGDLALAEQQGGAGYAAHGPADSLTHVMVWDPTIKLPFDAGGKWTAKTGWVDGKKQATGDHQYIGGKGIEMPTYITILHELGHFEQCLTKREQYLGWTKEQRSTSDPKARQSCTADIESDNLTRNEQPICNELGLNIRQTYFDRNNQKLLTADYQKFAGK